MAINAYYHLKAGGAGLKNGNDWDNAFDEPAFETFMEGGGLAAGDVIFIMEGDYTLDSSIDWSAVNGTETAPIALIGVKATTTNVGAAIVYSDWARDSANRPFFDTATFQIRTSNYNIIRNISFQGDVNYVLQCGNNCVVENCKIENDAAASSNNYTAIIGASGALINCEVTSTNARGIVFGVNTACLFCYIHDFTDDFAMIPGDGEVIFGNIFDACAAIAIYLTNEDDVKIINNTFYGNSTDVYGVGAECAICINNIIEGSTTSGFDWDTQTDVNFFWNNHGDDARCTDMWVNVDVTTVFQDYLVSTGNPLFTNPGVDHSLQATSPNLDNGMSIELGVG